MGVEQFSARPKTHTHGLKLSAKVALAILLAVFFLSQGANAPFQKDEETRPAGIVVQMVHSGSWIVPVDLYGQVTRKPPLFYWLSAFVAEVRGGVVDEAGARMVSVLSAA